MTAEIAILNKSTVALAADSAVTIGRGASAKIYNTVNKIFELHESAPVGIMIYGRMDFMGLPLETVIKEYRKQLGPTRFRTIKDYKADFIKWMSTEVPVSAEDQQMIVTLVASSILQKINKDADAAVFDEIRKTGKYLKSKDNALTRAIIRDRMARVKQQPNMPYASRAYLKRLGAQFNTIIEACINGFVDKISPNQTTRSQLVRLILESICREELSDNRTGIVVAGFGEGELCPSLERFEMDGVIGGEFKYIDGEPLDLDRKGPHAEVIGFAQDDMIERFLHGIDPAMHEYFSSTLRTAIERTLREIVGVVSHTAPQNVNVSPPLAALIEKIKDDHVDLFKQYKEGEFTTPIKDMIRHMPKQEIANLAKSLIDITSLKRKVSREQESVGGDVDVAVISKSEGFVWVHRKHYFPAELNARFFARHYSH